MASFRSQSQGTLLPVQSKQPCPEHDHIPMSHGHKKNQTKLLKWHSHHPDTETKWFEGSTTRHALIELIISGPWSSIPFFPHPVIPPPPAWFLKSETQESWLTPLSPLPHTINQITTKCCPVYLLNTCQSHPLVSIPSATISVQAWITYSDCSNSLLTGSSGHRPAFHPLSTEQSEAWFTNKSAHILPPLKTFNGFSGSLR